MSAVPGYRYHRCRLRASPVQPAGANKEGLVAAPVAEEIARYIAESGLSKPAVIGHSMGGTMGMMLAARHPQALSRLMVVDMVPPTWVRCSPGPAPAPRRSSRSRTASPPACARPLPNNAASGRATPSPAWSTPRRCAPARPPIRWPATLTWACAPTAN
ncbi:alpha/beta fold hydrolase [Massilia sp. Se16.2.3]|uniref:alpha/beta fold hydrolase n=1 Tax=Massilia sp. Se16.2.3 TaxID=2709303 RepID=UPI0035A72F0B